MKILENPQRKISGTTSSFFQIAVVFAISLMFLDEVRAETTEPDRKACEGGNPTACSRLAQKYEKKYKTGGYDIIDWRSARAFYAKACYAGDMKSCVIVADMYRASGDSPEGTKRAELYRKACEGSAWACNELAKLYDYGHGGLKVDSKKAVNMYEKSCAGNYLPACSTLGMKYMRGKVVMADNRDVKLIGLRLLEAVDIEEADLSWDVTESYQAAARKVIKGEAQVAFFLAEIYHSLSRLTKAQLSVLIESDLADISHVLLVKADFSDSQILLEALLNLYQDEDGKRVLTELGMPQGFEAMSEEDGEFMIDLMETLLD